MLLALRCFHSICENCEALLIAKIDLSAAIHHGLAHLAASRASRCITRVAQLIICFRVDSARVVIRADARLRGAETYAHIPHLAQLRRRSA